MGRKKTPVPGTVEDTEDDEADSETEVSSKKQSPKRPAKNKLHVPDSDPEELDDSRHGTKCSDGSDVLEELANEKREREKREQELAKKGEALQSEMPAHRARKIEGFDPDSLGPIRRMMFNVLEWKGFDTFIGVVIMLNGVTIGEETKSKVTLTPLVCDEDCVCTLPKDEIVCILTPSWVAVLEYIFFVIYVVELGARLAVYRLEALKNAWIRFDAMLVCTAIVDLILKIAAVNDATLKKLMLLRLFRLARLARAVRLMVQFQTLWQLVAGIMHSLGTLCWTFVLLSIMIYMFALFGMEFITVDTNIPMDHPYNVAALDNFRGLENAGLFLLQLFSWDSIGGVYRPLIKHQFLLFFYFMVVLLVNSIALANIVTAIMVEGALAQGEEDKDAKKSWEAAKKKKQMEQLKIMFLELDEDGSGELTMDEINAAPDEIRDQLTEIAGTDDIQSLFEMLDYDGGGTVGTDEFCEGVIKATNSEKPMELTRLLKQCSDILINSRKTVAILNGEDTADSKEGADDDSRPSPKKKDNQKAFQTNLSIQGLENRLGNMERTVTGMEGDVQKILTSMTKLLSLGTSNKVGNNKSGVKRAVAVCKGPTTRTSPS
eukprot:TRINITY_DN90846_c0_g1_i1.p1 TRINITY_DN90846_c0_g1~~TRINITY_DN90846_c0_g1_i1.p1  ORF type:complete len:622 (+),score=109.38 TRINITY_DN90846_c0_g1_i1:59-1867(+)